MLYGVTAISATNVWAVGYSVTSNAGATPTHALIEHWDGTSWSVVPSPSVGTNSNFLKGVTRVPGTNQVWAAGYYSAGSYTQTLIEFYC